VGAVVPDLDGVIYKIAKSQRPKTGAKINDSSRSFFKFLITLSNLA
jgi:hypothetical protein